MAAIAGPHRRLVVAGGWAEGAAAELVKAKRLGPFEMTAATYAGARGAALTAGRAAGLSVAHPDVHPHGGALMAEPVLEARQIYKSFGRVHALRGANFTVYPQEVVALVGDNGAGKSTLVKSLVGVHPPDSGEIVFEGKRGRHPHAARRARRSGSRPSTRTSRWRRRSTPAANMYLGREILRAGPARQARLPRQGRDAPQLRRGVPQPRRRASQDTAAPVANMSGGQRQGVAISRAVTWASKVVFMDEPTAALGVVQTRNVLDHIRRVRDQGISVVLISHNMPEVFEVADRIEVLRLGERVARLQPSEVTMEDVVSAHDRRADVPRGGRARDDHRDRARGRGAPAEPGGSARPRAPRRRSA